MVKMVGLAAFLELARPSPLVSSKPVRNVAACLHTSRCADYGKQLRPGAYGKEQGGPNEPAQNVESNKKIGTRTFEITLDHRPQSRVYYHRERKSKEVNRVKGKTPGGEIAKNK
jgi:hypothetical protein